MLKILSRVKIMFLEFDEFEILKKNTQKVFKILFENLNKLKEIINADRFRLDA